MADPERVPSQSPWPPLPPVRDLVPRRGPASRSRSSRRRPACAKRRSRSSSLRSEAGYALAGGAGCPERSSPWRESLGSDRDRGRDPPLQRRRVLRVLRPLRRGRRLSERDPRDGGDRSRRLLSVALDERGLRIWPSSSCRWRSASSPRWRSSPHPSSRSTSCRRPRPRRRSTSTTRRGQSQRLVGASVFGAAFIARRRPGGSRWPAWCCSPRWWGTDRLDPCRSGESFPAARRCRPTRLTSPTTTGRRLGLSTSCRRVPSSALRTRSAPISRLDGAC